MVSVSGVRGIIGKGLNPEVISRFSLAFGTFVKGEKVVIGMDTRTSGEMVKHAVVSGLLATGCDAIDLGVCPTPTVLYNVKSLKADGGIAITASHNPIEWNALKFIGKDAMFLNRKEAERLISIYENNKIKPVVWNKLGRFFQDNDGIGRHIRAVLSLTFLNVKELKKRKFRVAVDCVNGAASDVFPELLKRLGCNVVKVFCEPNGDFKRNPEPLSKNLSILGKMVKKTRADIGFATDADGDRLSIVSEKGVPLGEEYSLPLCAKFILSKKNGSIVTNFSTSRMIDYVAKEAGVRLFRAKVGEANVVKKMKDVKAVVGGEGNGGIILPDLTYTRDALCGIALCLQYLLESKRTVTQLKDELPEFSIVKKRKKLQFEKRKLDYKKIISKLPKGKINQTDGLRIDWKDSWLHIRKSGTEPIIRVIAEARTKKEAERLCNKVMELI